MPVTPLDIVQTLGGAAGVAALAKVWLDHSSAKRTAKIDLHRLAHDIAGEMLTEVRGENAVLRDRLDSLEERNDHLLKDLAAAHEKLRTAGQELIDTERALLVAEQEGARKEREILKLKTHVANLEAVIEDLNAQVAELTAALQECSKKVHPPAG